MHFDDVAIWIVEENLVPARHCPVAPIGIRDTLVLKMTLEGLDIIGPVSDMPLVDRVDELSGPETGLDIAARQMGLYPRLAICAMSGGETCTSASR